MEKVIWSPDNSANELMTLGDEEKFNTLLDRGYDPEMLGDANYDDIISNDTQFYDDDTRRLENEIIPMINAQTKDGIILCITNNLNDNRAMYAHELAKSPNFTLVQGDDGLVMRDKNDTVLFALPEEPDKLSTFITSCMGDLMEEMAENGDYGMTPEDSVEGLLDTIDIDTINDYCDFSQVPYVCDHIQATELGESLNEAKAKDPQGLSYELDEISGLVDEYGHEYMTALPFTSYDNDPESVELKYPNFFRVVKSFFKEMGILQGDELNDADLLDDNYDSLDGHDFDVILNVCAKLIDSKSVQFEKEFKTGFDDGLDNATDDTLYNDTELESLNEASLGDDDINDDFTNYLDSLLKKNSYQGEEGLLDFESDAIGWLEENDIDYDETSALELIDNEYESYFNDLENRRRNNY